MPIRSNQMPAKRGSRFFENPWRRLAEMEREMGSFFGNLPALTGGERLEEWEFSPTVDVKEKDKEFVFRFDLPGMEKDDINIELDENVLTVSGERREEREENGEEAKSHLKESFYGAFSRSFTLPMNVDADNVNASFKNGVLNVRIPKTEESRARQISVQ